MSVTKQEAIYAIIILVILVIAVAGWYYFSSIGNILCLDCGGGGGCIPKTCAQLGKNCGSGWSNGCGGTVNCGTCPTGQSCNAITGACYQSCSDGTAYGSCSATKPKYCSSGTLINKCLQCGCPTGQSCNTTSQDCYTTVSTPQSNLVGYWKFDEGSGTKAYDSSPNKNDGLINGPVWITGKSGKALQFDGTNDYVNATTKSMTTSQGTVILWSNIYSTTGKSYLFSHRNEGENNRIYLMNKDGRFNVGFGSTLEIDTGYNLPINQWTHLALTWSGANYNAYMNGNLIKSGTLSQPTSIANNLYLGSYLGITEFFNGVIDEVKVFNRALTAAEIKTEYGVQAPTCDSTCKSQGYTSGTCKAGGISGTNLVRIPDNWEATYDGGPQIYAFDYNVYRTVAPSIRIDGHVVGDVNRWREVDRRGGIGVKVGDHIIYKVWAKTEPSLFGNVRGAYIGFDLYGPSSRLWEICPGGNYSKYVYDPAWAWQSGYKFVSYNTPQWTQLIVDYVVTDFYFVTTDGGTVLSYPQQATAIIPWISMHQEDLSKLGEGSGWFADAELYINPTCQSVEKSIGQDSCPSNNLCCCR